MRDGEWLLGYSSYNAYPGASLTFGRESSGIYCLSEPDIAFADMDLADASLPGEDGVRMGRDYQRNATVTFELGVDGSRGPIDLHWPRRPWTNGDRVGDWTAVEEVAARTFKKDQGVHLWGLDGLNMLRQVWRADSIRAGAGRVGWLMHTTAGRTRQFYGRPRKFAVSHSRLSRQGYTPVVAQFEAVDDRFYDATEKEATVYDHRILGGLPPRPGRGSSGSWLFQSKKTAAVQQAGTLNTYPYVEIHGPCKNPKLSLSDQWAVQLSMTIDAGDHVTIDARPWVRTVTHYDGATSKGSVADKLTRASPRLAQMFIPPGYWTMSLSYTKSAAHLPTGPLIRMAWRDAYGWW